MQWKLVYFGIRAASSWQRMTTLFSIFTYIRSFRSWIYIMRKLRPNITQTSGLVEICSELLNCFRLPKKWYNAYKIENYVKIKLLSGCLIFRAMSWTNKIANLKWVRSVVINVLLNQARAEKYQFYVWTFRHRLMISIGVALFHLCYWWEDI